MGVDIKLRYNLNGLLPKVLPKIQDVIYSQIEAYYTELQQHMGTIPGTNDHGDWEELSEEALEEGPKFWYTSGETKKSIAMQVSVDGNRIRARAGIFSGSPAYQKALWNELGFTAGDGTVVRRPLFLPLAEEHIRELNSRLRSIRIRIRLQ